MKMTKTLFWITTGILFLLEGVVPVLTVHSPMTIAGMTHLGYPTYFVTLLTVGKALGAATLIIPGLPKNLKEWAYAGFGIDFTSAFVSIVAVDGWSGLVLLPVVAFALLALSYVSYRKLSAEAAA